MKPGTVRVFAGDLRGRRLRVPRGVRPSEGRLREALFSIWGERVVDARVLDLFAGSGAVGIEALSRGAREAVLVEGRAAAAAVLRINLEGVLPRGPWRLVVAELPRSLARLATGGPFDLVFADPPYRFDRFGALLEGLVPLLADGGEAALEHSVRTDPGAAPEGLVRGESRAYGDARLTFYRR